MIENRLRSHPTARIIIFGLVGVLLFLSLTGTIYQVSGENTLGTDFFIYYVAGRNITVNHQSPYAETVGEQSQMAILKHPARENEDQLRFVYPPYALIPVLPLTGFSFPVAQAAWMSFTLLSLSISIMYAFRKVSPWFLVSLLFLYPLSFGLLLGNLNIPVICILILLAGRLPKLESHQRFESCLLGILMAWATVKPQFSWFYLLFFLFVALKKKNFIFLVSSLAGIVGFLLFSFLLLPDWIPQWMGLLRRYPGYIGGRIPITPLINQFFPSGQMVVYFICAILFTSLTALFLIRWWRNQISSLMLLGWGGFVSYFFHPTGLSYDQVIFLLPILFWILQGWQKNPVLYRLSWLLVIAASWFLLWLSLVQIWPAATYYGLFLMYSLWILFGVFLPPRFLRQIEIS